MKFLKFLLAGIIFGVVMVKSEAVSWFRIQEMFRFQSFHMYGIIGSAVGLGVILIQWIKVKKLKSIDGKPIEVTGKPLMWKANLIGGSIFGLGWALTGACPGPLYTLAGAGYSVFWVVIAAALVGTFTYGALKKYLPH